MVQVVPEAQTKTQVSMLLVQEGPEMLRLWPFMLTSRETSTTPYSPKVNSIQVLEA